MATKGSDFLIQVAFRTGLTASEIVGHEWLVDKVD